jgi:outer membrane receptor protein involved in Fe transport
MAAQVTDTQQPASQKSEVASQPVVIMNVFNVKATQGQSYGASNMASATRTNTAIQNIPATINVINSNILADTDSFTLDQIARYTPGVTARINGSQDDLVIRGLPQLDHYEDGYLSPAIETDMSIIDRIEIIKGPSASIGGASEAAGLFNYITKRPLFTDQQSALLTLGSWALVRGVYDITGPVPDHDNMAFRVIASYLNSSGCEDNAYTRKTSVYPSFVWNITPNTELFVKVDLLDNSIPGSQGIIYLAPTYGGTATPIVVPANAKIQLGRFAPVSLNSSGWPGMERHVTYDAIFAVLTHQFSDSISVRQSFSYYTNTLDNFVNAVSNNLAYDSNGYLDGTFQTQHAISSQQSWRFQGDIALSHSFLSENISLKGLVGYQLVRTRGASQTFTSPNNVIPINILMPDYTQDIEAGLINSAWSRTANGSFATFANAQLGLFHDYVIITGGIRRDENKATWTYNLLNNSVSNTPKTPIITSPLFGLTVKPLPWFSLFAVSSTAGAAATTQSTYPGIATTDPRQVLVTITPDSTNYEYGAKFSLFNDNLSLNASHFDTTQNHQVLGISDPSQPGNAINYFTSGNNTRGFEFDWAGNLTRKLRFYGGYVNDKTATPGTKPNGGGGLELRATPRDKVQIFAYYELSRIRDRAFGIKAGIERQSSVYGNSQNTFTVAGATRFDMGFDYRTARWSFDVALTNLTNVIFPEYMVNQGSNTIDDMRNISFSALLKF